MDEVKTSRRWAVLYGVQLDPIRIDTLKLGIFFCASRQGFTRVRGERELNERDRSLEEGRSGEQRLANPFTRVERVRLFGQSKALKPRTWPGFNSISTTGWAILSFVGELG